LSSLATSVRPRVVERPAWRAWVTAKPLLNAPIHQWFVFPHSFSGELVTALVEEWGLGRGDLLADPFVGAGTTLVAGQEGGVETIGFDLSPLAVFASRVKSDPVDPGSIISVWRQVRPHLRPRRTLSRSAKYANVVHEAFDVPTLATLHDAKLAILQSTPGARERDFLYLALLRVLPRFSGLVQKGGWLTRVASPLPPDRLRHELASQVNLMLEDLRLVQGDRLAAQVVRSDARQLPVGDETVSAVITSPPYANRHDYTRVFAIELLFGFLDWHGTRDLRYQSFHSHPEAHPRRPENAGYVPPKSLPPLIAEIGERITDPRAKQRIPQMLEGYFRDLYLCLREITRVLKTRGDAAIVIGNVQYCGVQLEVDTYLAELAQHVGLVPLEIRIARHRGNSAQQMKEFGRIPARESVVMMRKE
jgi:DNA modification methylase